MHGDTQFLASLECMGLVPRPGLSAGSDKLFH